MRKNLTLTLLAGLLASGSITAAEPLPYGHPDFVPTPERPIGFQGDGNGHFPGATLVSEFWEGRPMWGGAETVKGINGWSGFVYADQVPKNILWKTELPGWTYAQPIPVKGRLYGIAEPDWVWCADQATGKILWQQRLTYASCQPELAGKPEEQKKLQEIYDIGRAAIFLDVPYRIANPKTLEQRNPNLSPTHPFVAKNIAILEHMKARIQALDPDPALLKACDEQIAAVKTYQSGGFAAVLKAQAAKQPALDTGPEVYGILATAITTKYKVSLRPLWMGWCPYVTSVPCSDGERVFACFGQGQLAAFDLDGKRLWSGMVNGSKTERINHWASPIVVGDRVLVRRANPLSLCAFRLATGEKLWERSGFTSGGHGSLDTPKHLRATRPGGGVLDLIIWQNHAVDAADGSLVAENLKDPFGKSLGANGSITMLARDGAIAMGSSEKSATARWKLNFQDGKPALAHEFAFDARQGPTQKDGEGCLGGLNAALLADVPVIVAGGATWDWNSGRMLDQLPNRNDGGFRGSMGSPATVIGRTMLGWSGDNAQPGVTCGRNRKDRSTANILKMTDLSDPRHLRPMSKWNLIGGAEPPSDIIFSTWLPGVDMFDFWLMHTGHQGWTGGGAFTGLPGWLGGAHCGSLAQGERTFIQTYKHLICVGPAVKGTANDDPKVVAAIRTETDAAKLEAQLASPSAQYRVEALQRVKTASEIVKKLAVQDPYEEIRAAAIQAMERAQAGSGQTLLKEQVVAFFTQKHKWMDKQELMDSFALAQTCRKLGSLADAPLAEAIAPVTEIGARIRLLVMIDGAGVCGPQIEKACLQLLTAAKTDGAALQAAIILGRAGKAKDHAEAIATVIEGQFVPWSSDVNDDTGMDPWVAVDAGLALPQIRARILAVLGKKVELGPNPNILDATLRRIEALGKDAAALKPAVEALKTKHKYAEAWLDRILAGMK